MVAATATDSDQTAICEAGFVRYHAGRDHTRAGALEATHSIGVARSTSIIYSMEVSVIIPCRNCARHLGQQLEALAGQDYEGTWEVIVVDNASTDDSRQIAEHYSDRLNLRIVDARGSTGASFARNVGAAAAAGRKLLFVDADDEVAPGYLSAMAAALDSSDFVTARVDTAALNPEWSRFAHGPWQQHGLLYLSEDFLPAAGPNVGVSRRVFDSVGGFPREFSAASEDIAFAWRVQLAGIPLSFVPDAVYRYRHRDSLWGLFSQTQWWGTHLAALYREFRIAGMPRRSLRDATRAWIESWGRLFRGRTKADIARAMVELGYCVGRLRGSVRYRVRYL
jgi:glycosyltransferase involved in cell wall biosynthesis